MVHAKAWITNHKYEQTSSLIPEKYAWNTYVKILQRVRFGIGYHLQNRK